METKRDTLRSAKKNSIWAETIEMPTCQPVRENLEADVCVVGGGIAGLTTAYLLGRQNKSVVLIDDGPLAGGQTTVTTAHLSNQIDDGIREIERWHGEENARLAVESHGAAIDQIEAIARDLDIDCDFKRIDAFLFLAPGDDPDVIEKEFAATKRAHLPGVEMVERAPLTKFDSGRCIRYPNQARFHPLKYLAGMAKAIQANGGRLFTKSHVDRIEGGDAAHVEVGGHTVRAGAIVVATNSPINDLVAIHTKQAPYMTYAIGARVKRGDVVDALYWDTLDAYHYVRLQPLPSKFAEDGDAKYDLLIVGGEDHKSGQADDANQRHARLEAWARARFPMEDVLFTWGGQCMETIDGLAFIGKNPMDKDNVYIVTGDSGMGLTHGTIAGMLLTDLITGRKNAWADLYSPSRKTIKAAGRFTSEAANVAGQYLKWLSPGEVSSVAEISNGSGAVIRRGMTKVAVYRDTRGKPHEMSAVCPHLQCIVHWNNAENTWDCPCHGSRFDKFGKVLNGPANKDLPPAE